MEGNGLHNPVGMGGFSREGEPAAGSAPAPLGGAAPCGWGRREERGAVIPPPPQPGLQLSLRGGEGVTGEGGTEGRGERMSLLHVTRHGAHHVTQASPE